MIFGFMRIALLLLAALAMTACNKKKAPKPADPVVETAPRHKTVKKIDAPATVPQALADRIAREWPAIKAEGDKFVVEFKKLAALRKEGDRAKMAVVVDVARGHYNKALEGWNGIYYSVDDYSEAKAEACRKFMRKWNRSVDSWTAKAKALKEYSQVK